MTRMVDCIKLGTQAEGLDFQPWPGDLGARIFDSVSKQAWQEWLRQQTILINEYKLNPLDANQRLRSDSVTETDRHREFQQIAPAVEADLYLVPKVID